MYIFALTLSIFWQESMTNLAFKEVDWTSLRVTKLW